MDSYRSYWNSSLQSTAWVESEDQDVYEVESRVPLPRPFPLCAALTEKNAVVVQTKISHVNHSTDGHLLKVVSRISLPTPPYTVSAQPPHRLPPRWAAREGLIFNCRRVNVSTVLARAHMTAWDALCHAATSCFPQGAWTFAQQDMGMMQHD